MHNRIRSLLESDLRIPDKLHKPLINLGLGKFNKVKYSGEPSKANGFDLPSVIGDSVIEVVKSGNYNGYSLVSGTVDARKAVVEK